MSSSQNMRQLIHPVGGTEADSQIAPRHPINTMMMAQSSRNTGWRTASARAMEGGEV